MPGEWYQAIDRKIEELKHKLLPRDVKEYQLDKLRSIARRVDEFAPGDPLCRDYQQLIESMVAELPGAPLPHDRNKFHICSVGAMVSHLKKAHHLVNEGEYLGLWLVFGLILGGVVGLLIGSTPPAAGAGLAIGTVIGMILDARAKREGRVI